MDYAISHAPIGTSFVIKAARFASKTALPEILRLSKDKDKEAAFSAFTEDDRIFIEMGGATDQLALLALASGSQVISIPSFMLGDKDAVVAALEPSGWKLKDEKPKGNETGDKLTARRNRALALVASAASNDPRLVPFREDEWRILRVKMLYRSYRQDQKAFLIAFQQLLARLRLTYMLEAAGKTVGEGEDKPARKSKAINAKQALDLLLKDFSEEERGEFMQKVGIEDASLRSSIPRERLDDLYEKLTERLMETDVAVSTVVTSMKDTKKKLEKTLAGMAIYRRVFEPIPGCGPLIAARFIANIGDIRRFRSLPALKAFAGYHHFEDGKRACRKAGVVSNWAPELKQAVYLLCDQTLKRKDSPWRHRLDLRRAYELYKLLEKRQLEAMEQDLDVDILPEPFQKRTIVCVNDMRPEDLEFLSTHLDHLRKTAGIKSIGADEEEDTADEEPTAKDPKLAKLVKGLKMVALQKAMRWLGQQFLKHVYNTWYEAIGLTGPAKTPKKNAPALSDDSASRRTETKPTDHKPVSWDSVPYTPTA